MEVVPGASALEIALNDLGNSQDNDTTFERSFDIASLIQELRASLADSAENLCASREQVLHVEAASAELERRLERLETSQADQTELTDVRATLERLEAVVTANDLKHNTTIDELRREIVTQSNAKAIKTNRTMIETNKELIAKLVEEGSGMNQRMTTAEEQIGQLSEDTQKLTETQEDMQGRQDGVIWRACQSLQGHFNTIDRKVNDLNVEMKTMCSSGEQFQSFSTQRFNQLFDYDEQVKEQIKFLMEASEMLKRRAREFNKNHTTQLKESISTGAAQERAAREALGQKLQVELQDFQIKFADLIADKMSDYKSNFQEQIWQEQCQLDGRMVAVEAGQKTLASSTQHAQRDAGFARTQVETLSSTLYTFIAGCNERRHTAQASSFNSASSQSSQASQMNMVRGYPASPNRNAPVSYLR